MNYRLHVIAESVLEAIQQAGGLMFDRRRAGWQVAVVTSDDEHPRALAILGVDIQSPTEFDALRPASEQGVCTVVSGTIGFPTWRHPDAGESPAPLRPVEHTLSAAARTFKVHALHCAGVETTVEGRECFWTDGTVAAGEFAHLLPDPDRSGSRSPTVVGG